MSYLAHALPGLERFGFGRPRAEKASHRTRTSAATSALWQALSGVMRLLVSLGNTRASSRRLRFVEKVALGDKQFVALLEIDGICFLASSGSGGPLTLTPAANLQVNAKPRRATKAAKPAAKPPAKTATREVASKREPALAARSKQQSRKEQAPLESQAVPEEKTGRRKRPQASAAKTPIAPLKESKAASVKVANPVLPKRAREKKPSVAARTVCATCQAAVRLSTDSAIPKALSMDPVESTSEAVQPGLRNLPKLRPDESSGALFPVEPEGQHTSSALPNPREARKEHQLVSNLEQDAEHPSEDVSPSDRFAALLELRMLASAAFEQIDTSTSEPAPRKPAPDRKPPPNETTRKASLAGIGLHRFRRRFGSLACFLVVFLLPWGSMHAATLPVSSFAAAQGAWSPTLSGQALSGPALSGPGAPQSRASLTSFSSAGVSLIAALAPRSTVAQSGGNDIRISGLGGSSASWSIVVLLTLLTLIPSLLMCVTPFARLLIVFHFLRQALGLQTTPSNQTLIGLSMILTFFLMQPVGAVIYRDSIVPAEAGKLTPLDAVARAGEPMRHFMAHYVREKDAELFLEIAKEPRPRSVDELSFRVLLPAYILSELKAGFQIGTVLFLPFLIVDMVVASITTSVGMMQLPPVVISTPLKLLLFLMVDGWHLLIGSLMRSFN